jgi:hypothetical protein
MGGPPTDGGVSACMSGLRCMMSMCTEPADAAGPPSDAPIGQ